MGSSPKNDMSPGNATPQPGSTPPPAAPPFLTAGFPGAPFSQGFAGQPFNENHDVYPSFLPKDPTASATGLDRDMLNAIMGISPAGQGRVAAGAAGPNASPAAVNAQPNMAIPQLQAPAEGSMRGQFQQAGQQLADKVNQSNSLEAYLAGRDQLAKLAQMGRFRRPGNSGQRGSGPGYGSSGPGGVGYGGGRTA